MTSTPTAKPVTRPPVETEATAVLELLQEPPEVPSVSVVEPPTQTVSEPEIVPAEGDVITVTSNVATAVPQEETTV